MPRWASARSAHGSTISAGLVPVVLATLRARGADVAAVLAHARLALPPADDPWARIPHREAFDLLEAAADVTGDDAFGVHVAEHLRRGSFGVIDYLVRCGPTLGDALWIAHRYQRLLQDADLRIEISAGRAVQAYRLRPAGPMSRALAECVLAGAVVWTRQLTGTALRPLEVRFVHARPRDTSEYERIFQSRIRYGADEDAVVLPARALDMPVVDADAGLAALLESLARRSVAQLPPSDDVRARVRDALARELRGGTAAGPACHGPPSTADTGTRAARVAARLRISPRTLRRRLRQEGTSLRALLDDLRRDLAIGYLRDQRLTIGETAFRLGFDDPSAFHKACRRLLDATPAAVTRRSAPGRSTT
jgi:AraC-like DNA-binding protein